MRRFIEKALTNCALHPEHKVLVALSGGADSVALLYVMRNLVSEGVIREIAAAHLHHGIRGEEAERDANFCKSLCKKLDIPLVVGRVDTPKYCAENRLTLEQAARELRYEFLNLQRQRTGSDAVALAHHRGDQAETVLLHLIRGSGLSGLCGMRYRNGVFIRPLLDVAKEDITAYLDELEQPWCFDSTNDDLNASRNRIRHSLIPKMAELNPNIEAALANMAQLLWEDADYLDSLAKKAGAECGSEAYKLLKLEAPIRSRVLKERLKAHTSDITRSDIERLTELLYLDNGSAVTLKGELSAWKENGNIHLGCLPKPKEYCFELEVGQTVETPRGSISARRADKARVPCAGNEAFIDASALCGSLTVRSRRDGDRFVPFGFKGTRLLSDYLTDRKVASFKRDMPLVCDEEGIVYVAGHTIADRVRIGEKAEKIIHLIFKEV